MWPTIVVVVVEAARVETDNQVGSRRRRARADRRAKAAMPVKVAKRANLASRPIA